MDGYIVGFSVTFIHHLVWIYVELGCVWIGLGWIAYWSFGRYFMIVQHGTIHGFVLDMVARRLSVVPLALGWEDGHLALFPYLWMIRF